MKTYNILSRTGVVQKSVNTEDVYVCTDYYLGTPERTYYKIIDYYGNPDKWKIQRVWVDKFGRILSKQDYFTLYFTRHILELEKYEPKNIWRLIKNIFNIK